MFFRFCRGLILAFVAAISLSACTTQPIMNVTEAQVVTSKSNPSLDEIRQAIIRAGTQLGWQMKAERPGHIVGSLSLRTHVAVVDIDYDRKSYSIKYKDSTNLEYNGSTIHRNYNGWIQRLDQGIKSQLSGI
jgi:hypothetical protein